MLRLLMLVVVAFALRPLATHTFSPELGVAYGSKNIDEADVGDHLLAALEVPVAWELTRARFRAGSHATESESYRESWIFHWHSSGTVSLSSPRAKIEVLQLFPEDTYYELPETLILAYEDFLALIGISQGLTQTGRAKHSRVVRVNLVAAANGKTIVVNLAEDEHLSVSLHLLNTKKL